MKNLCSSLIFNETTYYYCCHIIFENYFIGSCFFVFFMKKLPFLLFFSSFFLENYFIGSCFKWNNLNLLLLQSHYIWKVFYRQVFLRRSYLFSNFECSLTERFCLLVFASLAVQHGQVV